MPIYRRTGDNGTTGLASGQRVAKDSAVIDFIGELDELNSEIGFCVSYLDSETSVDFTEECEILEEIQRDLFVVGAIAVGASLKFNSQKEISNIEKTIDDYEKILPKLKNFILPGGSLSGASIHKARTKVRKIERKLVGLKSKSVMPFLPYLNRLSDLLFVMARYVNYKSKKAEVVWKS